MLIASSALAQTEGDSVDSGAPLTQESTVQNQGQAMQNDGNAVSFQLVRVKYPPDIACITRTGKIKVAIYGGGERPPFFMRDKDGELVGIDVDLARDIAEKFGAVPDFNFTAGSYDELVELVASGQAHIGISKLSLTLERAKKVLYSKPYVHMGKAILVNALQLEKFRKGSKDTVRDIFNQPGVKIGVIDKSSYVEFAKRLFPEAEVVPMDSWDSDIIPKVLSGEITAAFRDEWETRQIIDKTPDATLKLQNFVITGEQDPISMIFPWGSNLREWVNHFIDITHRQYDIRDLMDRNKKFEASIEGGEQ
ncbi:MAG: substrate-binding periplasmic protein [Alphaproteobacteria bacterium]